MRRLGPRLPRFLAALAGAWALACGVPRPAPAPPSAAAAAPASAPSAAAPVSADAWLRVVSLNDLHGRLGALPAFAGYVEAVRRQGNTVLVDAGDMFQGTIGSNLTEGAAVIAAYNALGMDAAALGNHEFDYGPSRGASSAAHAGPQGALRRRLEEARFPILSANLLDRATGKTPAWTNLKPSVLLERAGVRLGVIGVLTEFTSEIVVADWFAGLDVAPLAPAVEREARALRDQGAEAVIVLAHAGAVCERFDDPRDLSSCRSDDAEAFDLARALPAGLVDVIVGGHTHAGVAHVVNGIAIIEAMSRGKAFGRVDLRLGGAPRRVLEARLFPPEPLCPDSSELAPCATRSYAGSYVHASSAIDALIRPALELARRERARPLGVELTSDFPRAHGEESPLGNLFVDALRAYVKGSDAAIGNGGSLRADLPRGPLSYGLLYEAMPFDNRLVSIELGGDELRRVLARHLSHGAHGIVSISGLRVAASCGEAGLAVKLARDDGRPVRDADKLNVVTSDYLAFHGDRLFEPIGLERSRVRVIEGVLVRDALAEELGRRGRLDAADPKIFDRSRPRLSLPAPRPITCPAPRG